MINNETDGDADERTAELAAATQPPPKVSLGEMLGLMRAADEGVLNFDLDLEALGKDLREKVDDITEYLDYCTSRAAVIGARASELGSRASAFSNKHERLKTYVASNMATQGAPELPGNSFRFRLRHSDAVEIKQKDGRPVEATPALYLRLKAFIKREYSWKKGELKKALKAKDPAAMEVASLKQNPWVDISPRI